MKLYFLEATAPQVVCTKTFRSDGTTIHKEPYPNISRFTSFAVNANDIDDLYVNLVKFGEAGLCHLKGQLLRDLEDESRARATDSNGLTEVLVLDADGLENIHTPQEFVAHCLPKEFQDVSYIYQPSASAYLPGQLTFRGHLYFVLNSPQPAPLIKEWLKHQNLTNQALIRELELTASGLSLRYGLDITASQEDKLIYIAKPICQGFKPNDIEPFTLIRGNTDTLDLDLSDVDPAVTSALVDEKVNELRNNKGLAPRKPKYKDDGHELILTNPERAVVTGIRINQEFTHLNLNGGDSWAYWHFTNDPKLLYNFKGEPTCLLRDIAPEYWGALRRQARREHIGDTTPLTIWCMRKDQYFVGSHDAKLNTVELWPVSGKDKLMEFCNNHSIPLPDPIPIWDVVFEPTNDKVIDYDARWINRYQKTQYIQDAQAKGPLDTLPPIAEKIIRSATGDDEESFQYFLNWLAYIYQKRTKTRVAWVLHGTEGTGKGLLFNNILVPTIGSDYCKMKSLKDLKDLSNDWLADTILGWFDEVYIDARDTSTLNQVKNLITEPTYSIRALYVGQQQADLFNNFIMAGNLHDLVRIPDDDRRFNVAPRQENKLHFTDEMEEQLKDELVDICRYFLHYPLNEYNATHCLENEAKAALRANTETASEQFFRAIKEGDLNFFLEWYHDRPVNDRRAVAHQMYKTIVAQWADYVDTPCKVSRADLQIVYTYVQASSGDISSNMFSRMLKHRDIKCIPLNIDGKTTRGITITWKAESDYVKGVIGNTSTAASKLRSIK